jgi:hypothetical protein
LLKEGKMPRTFTAYVEFDPESKLYVGTVPGLPGAHSQWTLDELARGNRVGNRGKVD